MPTILVGLKRETVNTIASLWPFSKKSRMLTAWSFNNGQAISSQRP